MRLRLVKMINNENRINYTTVNDSQYDMLLKIVGMKDLRIVGEEELSPFMKEFVMLKMDYEKAQIINFESNKDNIINEVPDEELSRMGNYYFIVFNYKEEKIEQRGGVVCIKNDLDDEIKRLIDLNFEIIYKMPINKDLYLFIKFLESNKPTVTKQECNCIKCVLKRKLNKENEQSDEYINDEDMKDEDIMNKSFNTLGEAIIDSLKKMVESNDNPVKNELNKNKDINFDIYKKDIDNSKN